MVLLLPHDGGDVLLVLMMTVDGAALPHDSGDVLLTGTDGAAGADDDDGWC